MTVPEQLEYLISRRLKLEEVVWRKQFTVSQHRVRSSIWIGVVQFGSRSPVLALGVETSARLVIIRWQLLLWIPKSPVPHGANPD
jgi:hypothetical protein